MSETSCWFCDRAEADPARAVPVDAEQSVNVGLKQVSTQPVLVPRCAACAGRHRRRQSLGAVTLTLVVLSWIGGLPLVMIEGNGPVYYLAACVAVTLANVLFWRWRDRSDNAKPVYAAEDHPALAELRRQGYSLVVRR